MEFLLKRSNSYRYYKDHYESSKEDIEKLEKKLKRQIKLNKVYEKRMANKANELSSCNKDLHDINIAYVLNQFPVHSETFIVSEVRWLVDNGYNVFVFSRVKSNKSIDLDFEVNHFRFKSKLDLEQLLVDNEIDIMHSHFVYPICTKFTYPVAEKLKIPFTVFTHAYDIFIKENDKRNKIAEISKSEQCLAVFTLSNFHKEYLLERDVDENKIVITKQASNYDICEIKEKPNDIKKIVSISRFVEKKGIDTLIDAAKLLEDESFEFHIYGFGHLEEQLQKQIDEMGCKNIEIKGELHPDEVDTILKTSDLLAAPSKIAENGDLDGFPTIIFEAMAVGTPFITTDVSAIPEIVEDGVNGFMIESDNPKLLADKILEVSKLSSERMFEIRSKAQEDVVNISSVDKTMERFFDTISEGL